MRGAWRGGAWRHDVAQRGMAWRSVAWRHGVAAWHGGMAWRSVRWAGRGGAAWRWPAAGGVWWRGAGEVSRAESLDRCLLCGARAVGESVPGQCLAPGRAGSRRVAPGRAVTGLGAGGPPA
ncbi:hypothetical protein FXF51_42180 [Nonomuraea sp. PA05]|nr:hypothetical protein FXF51_42180 [Nonomuraea sp. PA05]